MGFLYRLTFADGKQYIGATKHKYLSDRVGGHRTDAKKSSSHVYEAWRKLGEPSVEKLAIVENNLLAETEARAIKVFGTLWPDGYNTVPDSFTAPSKHPLVAAKISRVMKAQGPQITARLFREWADPEVSKRRQEGTKRANNTPECKALRKRLTTESWRDKDLRARLIAGIKSQASTPSAKLKRSAATSRLVWVTDGTASRRIDRDASIPVGWYLGRAVFKYDVAARAAKLSISLTGKKHSDAAKARMSVSKLERASRVKEFIKASGYTGDRRFVTNLMLSSFEGKHHG